MGVSILLVQLNYIVRYFLLNGTTFGVTLFRPLKRVTPKVVPISVSVLAMVTNKVEPRSYDSLLLSYIIIILIIISIVIVIVIAHSCHILPFQPIL